MKLEVVEGARTAALPEPRPPRPDRLEPRTLIDVLDECHLAGDARGCTFVDADGNGPTFGFRTLVDEARRRGRQLVGLGLRKGDRVALVIPEAKDFVLTFLGAVTAGIVPVPLYPPLSLGRLDAYLGGMVRTLNAAAVDLVVTSAQVQKILWPVLPRVPTARDLVTVEQLAGLAESSEPAPDIAPTDPLFLQFTSGSTAAPKGVVVTHGSLCANAVGIMKFGLEATPERDVAVSWLPLYHDMGLIGFVLSPLFIPCATVFIPTVAFVKRPSLWMETIHRHRGTITFAPNFAFARVTKRASDAEIARWDLSCLRVVGCGAEPIHAGTMRAFVERFGQAGLPHDAMLPCYGMAEATLAMSFVPLRQPLQVDSIDPDACYAERRAVPASTASGALELVACGRPFPGHELGIFDDDDRPLGDRQIGEIRYRGPSVAAGYFRNAEQTRAVFGGAREDGWLRTGDLGYMADGSLYISGRKKDILIIHGRNYYPQGIEWLVEEVAGIRKGNVVAFSVPGATAEEIVVVAETTEADAAARARIAAEVKRHVNEAMALAVGDVTLVGLGELPKTTSGKLQRAKTREQYLAGTLGTEGVRSLSSGAQKLALARHLAAGMVSRLRHRIGTRLGMGWLAKSRQPEER
ncbi:MAG TPA: fatty acyl-AMP ligase [Kofleriaceae bacterium]|nr:fatty acyl-AMP ligase [Kofleriaceae bacterium]